MNLPNRATNTQIALQGLPLFGKEEYWLREDFVMQILDEFILDKINGTNIEDTEKRNLFRQLKEELQRGAP